MKDSTSCGKRSFTFALIELFQPALLALRNMAVNALRRSLRIGRLQSCDQVQMVAVDLFQRRQVVPAAPGCENADQQPDARQRLQASPVACELHDVGVKRKVGHLKALHLFLIQESVCGWLPAP